MSSEMVAKVMSYFKEMEKPPGTHVCFIRDNELVISKAEYFTLLAAQAQLERMLNPTDQVKP